MHVILDISESKRFYTTVINNVLHLGGKYSA